MNAIDKPQRRWSLRALLSLNLVSFALVPALLVMFWMYRNNLENIHDLSDKLIEDMATDLRVNTEYEIGQVHKVLDGFLVQQPGPLDERSARYLLKDGVDFERIGFALTRLTRAVVFVQMAQPNGEFISVRRSKSEQVTGTVVHQRLRAGADDQFFDAQVPGDRSRPILPLVKGFNVLQRPWYQSAVSQKTRSFSPIYPSLLPVIQCWPCLNRSLVRTAWSRVSLPPAWRSTSSPPFFKAAASARTAWRC